MPDFPQLIHFPTIRWHNLTNFTFTFQFILSYSYFYKGEAAHLGANRSHAATIFDPVIRSDYGSYSGRHAQIVKVGRSFLIY